MGILIYLCLLAAGSDLWDTEVTFEITFWTHTFWCLPTREVMLFYLYLIFSRRHRPRESMLLQVATIWNIELLHFGKGAGGPEPLPLLGGGVWFL